MADLAAATEHIVTRREPSRRRLPPARTLNPPDPAREDRSQWGRSLRQSVPRRSQSAWEEGPDRFDPVEVLIDSNRVRDQDLVPIRYYRMLASPFAFLRGSALIMALDLATTPSAGIDVQLCGDAHLVNFGLFASPERRLLFDLNDFDETWPGPFEWDLKRLCASAVVAARASRLGPAGARKAALAGVRGYREHIHHYAGMHHLDVWYDRIDANALSHLLTREGRRVADQAIEKASTRDHHRAVAKLTAVVDGVRRILPDPPLVTRMDGETDLMAQLPVMIEEYRHTLSPDRLALFDHYRLVDFARKVVGVGSVGTLCWILLMEGPNGGPLFLQAKQALPSALRQAGLPGPGIHDGERVVHGQHRLQAASDILLGWTTAPGSENAYYLRQLWDSKGTADVASMNADVLARYVGVCGWALARAHARTGGSCSIAGYIGTSDRFDQSIADFAEGYADQTERDFNRLRKAANRGLIPVRQA